MFTTNGVKGAPLKAEVRDVFFKAGLPPGYAPPRIIFQRDANGLVSGYLNGGLIYRKSELVPLQDNAPSTPSVPAPGPLRLRDFVVHHSGDVAVAAFFHDRDTPYYGQVLHQTYRSMETWVKRGTAWKMIASQGRAMQKDPPAVMLPPDQLSEYLGTYVVGETLTVTVTRNRGALAMSTSGSEPVPLEAAVRDGFFTPGFPRISMIFRRDSSGRVTGYVSRREGRDLTFTKASGPTRNL